MKYIEITIKGKSFLVKAEKIKHQIWFHFKGHTFVINQAGHKPTGRKPIGRKPGGFEKAKPIGQAEPVFNGQIISPMPGQVVQVCVQVGQAVKKNQTLAVLSSMKMEYTILTPAKGVVRSIKTKEGAQVALQDVLMEIQTKTNP